MDAKLLPSFRGWEMHDEEEGTRSEKKSELAAAERLVFVDHGIGLWSSLMEYERVDLQV